MTSVDALTTFSGSVFQMEEAAAGKARLPTVDILLPWKMSSDWRTSEIKLSACAEHNSDIRLCIALRMHIHSDIAKKFYRFVNDDIGIRHTTALFPACLLFQTSRVSIHRVNGTSVIDDARTEINDWRGDKLLILFVYRIWLLSTGLRCGITTADVFWSINQSISLIATLRPKSRIANDMKLKW